MKPYLFYIRSILLSMIAGLLFMGIFAKRGWFDWRRIVLQNEQLASKIELARVQQQDLQRRTRAMRTDRRAQERAVRSELGYVKAYETVIEF